MTQRYMHLSPAALDAAIRLLEGGLERSAFAEGYGGQPSRGLPAEAHVEGKAEQRLEK